jgi:ubiquinone/menaquinone biosynthesis C-methylase UbiE
MSRKKFDDFDDFARDYRQIHNENIKLSGVDSDYFSEQKVAEIRKNEPAANLTILDLGCGDGNSAVFFQKHFDDSQYFGLDVSKESIRAARARKLSRAEFAHYDGIDIPFAADTFDVILIACVLHHVAHDLHESVLSEVRRVLKPEGRLYIFEHNPFNPVTQKVVKDCPFDRDAVLLNPFYTKRMLSKLSYREIAVNYTIFFPRTKIFNKLLFLEDFLKWFPLGGQYYTKSIKGKEEQKTEPPEGGFPKTGG